jgi:hypothetical protein
MMIEELQELVEAHFPASADESLIRGISEGIALADQLRKSGPMLRGLVGRDLAGHLRRAGVISRIHDLCQRGELPFQADIDVMPIGNWHHLVLKASDTISSNLCRTDTALAFPKDTPNRQDERLTNQPDLFDENVISLSASIKAVEEKCVWLTYGYTREGDLTHACWAMPSQPAVSETWHAHINVVERFRRLGQTPKVERKGVDRSGVLKFKRDIDEALSKQDQKRQKDD